MKSKPAYRKKLIWLFLTVLSGLCSMSVHAQYEPMFTQYMFNELFINPAYAGSHDNLASTMLYRDQWVGIDGAPKTQTLSLHAPIRSKRIGLGMSVLNENIAVTHQFAAYADFAYRIIFRHSALSFGLQGGFVNDEEHYSDVRTTTPGDNQFQYDARKLFLPNAGFGIYYYQKKFYAGFSIPRLLENKIDASKPNTVVHNAGTPALWHYYLATGYVFDLNDDVKLKPSVMIKAVPHAPMQADLNANLIFRDFLWIGAAYRTGDAVAGLIAVQLNRQLRLGYSYDYTLTELQRFNSGTHEISLSFDFSFIKNRIITPRYF